MPELSNVAAIKIFFEQDNGRKVDLQEVKALSGDERLEIGRPCIEALASK